MPDGSPRTQVPAEVLDSIRRNRVCLKGTLFTELSKKNTSTQSLNVQMRKDLDTYVNLVHGFSIPGLVTRYQDLDIVVIRCALCVCVGVFGGVFLCVCVCVCVRVCVR